MGAYQPGAANWAPAQSTIPGMIPGSELGLSGLQASTRSQRPENRKTLNEEYFAMCLLSLKMKNKASPWAMGLNSHALFEKSQKEQGLKDFTKYYDWIEEYI